MSTELPTIDEAPQTPTPDAAVAAPQDADTTGIAAAAALMEAHKAGVDVTNTDVPAASDEAKDLVAAAMFGEAPKAEAPEGEPKAEEPKADAPKGDEPKEEAKDDFEKSIQEIEDEYGSVVAAPMRAMADKIKELSAKTAPAPENAVAPAQAFHDFIDANGAKYAGIIGASSKTATKDQLRKREDVGLTASALFNSMAQQRPPITPAERAEMEKQAILLAMEAVADPTRFRAAMQNREAAKRSSHRTHAAGGNVYERNATPGRNAAPAPTRSADEVGIDIVSQMLSTIRR